MNVDSKNFVGLALVTEAASKEETLHASEVNALAAIMFLLQHAAYLASKLKRGVFYNKPQDRQAAIETGYRLLSEGLPSNVWPTNSPDDLKLTPSGRRLLHGLLGKIDELGELAECLDPRKPVCDHINLVEELGDDNWYQAIIMDTVGVSFDTVLTTVIRKLQKRYPQGYTDQAAQTRDLVGERQVLETTAGSAVQ